MKVTESEREMLRIISRLSLQSVRDSIGVVVGLVDII